MERYGTAIEVLSKFIEEKTRIGQGQDKDTAAAYYNRACYKLLRMQQMQGDEAAKIKDSAYEDLDRAIKQDPDTKIDARADDDFQVIRQEERFNLLTGTS